MTGSSKEEERRTQTCTHRKNLLEERTTTVRGASVKAMHLTSDHMNYKESFLTFEHPRVSLSWQPQQADTGPHPGPHIPELHTDCLH